MASRPSVEFPTATSARPALHDLEDHVHLDLDGFRHFGESVVVHHPAQPVGPFVERVAGDEAVVGDPGQVGDRREAPLRREVPRDGDDVVVREADRRTEPQVEALPVELLHPLVDRFRGLPGHERLVHDRGVGRPGVFDVAVEIAVHDRRVEHERLHLEPLGHGEARSPEQPRQQFAEDDLFRIGLRPEDRRRAAGAAPRAAEPRRSGAPPARPGRPRETGGGAWPAS